ncbi:HAD-IIB family hydrolase [Roseivirga sp.]|uniref:HAD-IIB family hydrolase n=1 Tax=Roseivirga sp. TaxID=1964215 RepID=UPI003B522446
MRRVLFSDLDGTLLDLKSYSFARTLKSVGALKSQGIPIVFCSSKSRVEQEFYRDSMEVKDPFIVENGSAIFIPRGYFSQKIPYNTYVIDDYEVIALGKPVGFIRDVISKARESMGLSLLCYFDLPAEEVSMYTGLDLRSSRRAMEREFSETILKGRVTEGFNDYLKKNGLRNIPGSKFQTVVSDKADKGKAVDILISLYEKEWGGIISYGAGDSINDFEMLQSVHDPYLVQRPTGLWADLEDDTIKKVNGIGPSGWNKVAQIILEAPAHG